MVNECLLPGCGKKLSKRFHFCAAHWAMVPPVLQRAVETTYARYVKKREFDPYANEQHRKQWRLARGVAVTAVRYALGEITEDELKRVLGPRRAAIGDPVLPTEESDHVDPNAPIG